MRPWSQRIQQTAECVPTSYREIDDAGQREPRAGHEGHSAEALDSGPHRCAYDLTRPSVPWQSHPSRPVPLPPRRPTPTPKRRWPLLPRRTRTPVRLAGRGSRRCAIGVLRRSSLLVNRTGHAVQRSPRPSSPRLVAGGARVEAGDLLVEFDPQPMAGILSCTAARRARSATFSGRPNRRANAHSPAMGVQDYQGALRRLTIPVNAAMVTTDSTDRRVRSNVVQRDR